MLPFFLGPLVNAAATPERPDSADLSSEEPFVGTVIGAGGNRPRYSLRINSDGNYEGANNNTGSALSYSSFGQWLDTNAAPIDNTDWEAQLTVNSEDIGDPGTWTGSTRGSWVDISTDPFWTWTKDANDLGTCDSIVTVEIRQKSKTDNSFSLANVDFNLTITT